MWLTSPHDLSFILNTAIYIMRPPSAASVQFAVMLSRKTVRTVPLLAQARLVRHWAGLRHRKPDTVLQFPEQETDLSPGVPAHGRGFHLAMNPAEWFAVHISWQKICQN